MRTGAGKPTTLRMLLGLSHPAHGVALIQGRPCREVQDQVGGSLTATGFNPGRTARGRVHPRPRRPLRRRRPKPRCAIADPSC